MISSVLHINTSLDTGGAAQAVMRLHTALRDVGVDSHALAGRQCRIRDPYISDLPVSKPQFLLNVALFRALGIEGALNSGLWRKVLKGIDRYSVVHVHNTHGYYLPLDMLGHLLCRPSVWTLHDHWVATGRLGSRPFHGARKSWGERLFPFVGFGYPMEILDRSVQRKRAVLDLIHAHRPILICPSHALKDAMVESGVDSDLLRVIHHGVFTTPEPSIADRALIRRDLGWPEDKFILVFAAAQIDAPNKGLATLLDAMKRFSADARAHLFVVGGREAGLRRRTSHPSITFTGLLPHKELHRMLAAADALVAPTLEESFGLAIVEAAGMGTCVVASDLAVTREVGGAEVLTFKPNDADALASTLQTLLQSGPETEAVRLDRARKVRSRFLMQDWVSAHQDAYRDAAIR